MFLSVDDQNKKVLLFEAVAKILKKKRFDAFVSHDKNSGVVELCIDNILPQNLPYPMELRKMFFDSGVELDLTLKEYARIQPTEFIPKYIKSNRFSIL